MVFAVAVVALELEERMRRGMWWGLLIVRVRPLPLVVLLLFRALVLALPPLLLMLVLGRRVVMVLWLLVMLLFMVMLKDRLDLRGW